MKMPAFHFLNLTKREEESLPEFLNYLSTPSRQRDALPYFMWSETFARMYVETGNQIGYFHYYVVVMFDYKPSILEYFLTYDPSNCDGYIMERVLRYSGIKRNKEYITILVKYGIYRMTDLVDRVILHISDRMHDRRPRTKLVEHYHLVRIMIVLTKTFGKEIGYILRPFLF